VPSVPVVHINECREITFFHFDGGYPEVIPHERDSKLIDISYFHVLVLESMGMGKKKSKSQMIYAASSTISPSNSPG
jgi:hypothetical protein